MGSKRIYMVGSKGIPSSYGGYETFVDRLVQENEKNFAGEESSDVLEFYVACKSDVYKVQEYHGAICTEISVPKVGPAQAVLYDLKALRTFEKMMEDSAKDSVKGSSKDFTGSTSDQSPIVYIMACRIGPFFKKHVKKIHALGGKVYVNPDGHEWMRAKWSRPIRKYWKFSEKLMVKHADLLVCDSKNIEKYILETYAAFSPNTTYIAYGADVENGEIPVGQDSVTMDGEIPIHHGGTLDGMLPKDKDVHFLSLRSEKYRKWLEEHNLYANEYYLIVGRFVPENNYETMIREFMASHTEKKLAIITKPEGMFYEDLKGGTHFQEDDRIQFVGTVYDQALLQEIRKNAYGYLHGHEVGGTNPSLLEALGATKVNLLLDVGFNREVGEDAALYWTKEEGNLAALIEDADKYSAEERERLGHMAKERIRSAYSWKFIYSEYRKLFLGE